MLNYAYVIEAGRLARALAARGLALQIGFLHKPKRGRNSLVWDAIEPLRPMIDARVFEFVAAHEFGRSRLPASRIECRPAFAGIDAIDASFGDAAGAGD